MVLLLDLRSEAHPSAKAVRNYPNQWLARVGQQICDAVVGWCRFCGGAAREHVLMDLHTPGTAHFSPTLPMARVRAAHTLLLQCPHASSLAGALPFAARLFSSSTGSGNRLAGTSSVELQDLEAAAAAPGGTKPKCVLNLKVVPHTLQNRWLIAVLSALSL